MATKPPTSALAESIVTLFDRSGFIKPPEYVSRKPALHRSLVISGLVLLVGLGPILADRRLQRDSNNTLKQLRWILMLTALFALCVKLQDMLVDRLYLIDSVTKNSQHFANVFWLRKYTNALRG